MDIAVLGACAEARHVPPERFDEWLKSEDLLDPERFVPRLDAALVALVPPDAWLFDRRLVGQTAD